ncbi:zinc finger domain-containing protein, partial [Globicatella sulfidifaciens]
QEQLKVYGRPEEPCPRCGQLISKIQFAGRGTHFCSHCQPVACIKEA